MYMKAETIEENNVNQLAFDLAPKLAIARSRIAPLRICISRKLSSILSAKRRCVREFTPNIPLGNHVYDAEGKILYRAGQEINAFDMVQFENQIIFIDGLDKRQIAWALKEALKRPTQLVFLGGTLLKKLGVKKVKHYFDQKGDLPVAFNIRCLPSIVTQEGRKFRIEEVPM